MAKTIDFAYLRKHCDSCKKAVSWLDGVEHAIKAQEDASRIRKSEEEAIALARKAKTVLVSKGKSLVRFTMDKKSAPADDELASALMGPTGNLRAPTFLVGKTLLVGFNEEAYREVFAS